MFPVVSGAGALATSELDCRAKADVNGGPPQSQLAVAMALGIAKMKSEKHRDMFP